MNEHRVRVEELVAEYRQSKLHLGSVHQQLSTITASAASSDGAVTSTVSARGTLIDLVIDDQAYRRYQPVELAEQIILATASASSTVAAQASALLAPLLPQPSSTSSSLGLSLKKVQHGGLEGRRLDEPEASMRGNQNREEGDFAEQDWVRDEAWS